MNKIQKTWALQRVNNVVISFKDFLDAWKALITSKFNSCWNYRGSLWYMMMEQTALRTVSFKEGEKVIEMVRIFLSPRTVMIR